mmetsp:Transcript_9784/g.12708  ORF Transcript_9784/g.12708 Transcript_9784/m.12708 type:complete len:516 (+) Transcript_9784:133-1680(+)
MRFVIGIDLGTTQTKSVLVDELGNLIDKSSASIPVYFPRTGWVEQKPLEILESVKTSVGNLLKRHPELTSENTVVGFDNQGETFILWNKNIGEAVTPAIVWQDTRGQKICEDLLTTNAVDENQLRKTTGLRLDSYFSAPKLLWVFQQQPEILAAARAGDVIFGTTDSFVLWHLSNGKLHITDPSTASRTLLFNINIMDWDQNLLDAFQVPKCMLPTVKPSAGYVGDIELTPGNMFSLHGLLVDQQASLFGQACFEEGDMKCSFGTGSFLLMNIGTVPKLSSNGLLTTVAWVLGGSESETEIETEDRSNLRSYALDGGVFVTGAAVQWLKDNLEILDDVGDSDEMASKSTDSDVVVVPAFQGLAAPHWETSFKCSMFGISRSTSKIDIVRATLDGIACRIYEVAKSMILDLRADENENQINFNRLKVDGGPTKNSYLMQRISDLLDMEVHVMQNTEGTAIGVANLASFSAYGTDLSVFSNSWKAERIYKPAMMSAERERILGKWGRAIEATRIFHA